MSRYVSTWLALVILATLSLLISFFHSSVDLPLSLVIAVAKSLLVLWVFMHLGRERLSSRVALAVAVALMAVLIGLTATDVATRHTAPAGPEPTASSRFQR